MHLEHFKFINTSPLQETYICIEKYQNFKTLHPNSIDIMSPLVTTLLNLL
jgi:hypothetical protein